MNASKETRSQMVIAVDGPSGSGKSSISRESAKRLGFSFLDTGAMYRALTIYFLKQTDSQRSVTNFSPVDVNLSISIDPEREIVEINNIDVTKEIRSEEVTKNVSHFAANPEIRNFLVLKQREIISSSKNGIVVEGRDIGSVVIPDADLKLFITASEEKRAARRALQINSNMEDVLNQQKIRDKLDSERTISPLTIPKDAVILDNSELDFEQSVKKFIDLVVNHD